MTDDDLPAPCAEAQAHLIGCATCLACKLALDAADLPRPSDLARARLRAAVAAELATPARAWSWWQRPLAVALATAATLLAIATVSQLHTRPARPPHALVDGR